MISEEIKLSLIAMLVSTIKQIDKIEPQVGLNEIALEDATCHLERAEICLNKIYTGETKNGN